MSELLNKLLLDRAPVGIYIVNSDWRIILVNAEAQPVFGTIQNLGGSDFRDVMRVLWPPARAQSVIEAFAHTMDTGESYYEPELVEMRADLNTIQYYDWQIHRVMHNGKPAVICYFLDISTHVQARQVLQESKMQLEMTNKLLQEEETQKLLASLSDNSPAFVGLAEAGSYRVIYVNPSGRRLVNLTRENEGKVISEFVYRGIMDDFQHAVDQTMTNGKWEGQMFFRNFATEKAIPVYQRIWTIADENDKVTHLASVAIPLNEIEARNLLVAKLKAQVKAPLAELVNALQLLRDAKDLKKAKSFSESALGTTTNLLQVLSELLDDPSRFADDPTKSAARTRTCCPCRPHCRLR